MSIPPLALKQKDVLSILNITSVQLKARIKKGIYPKPQKDELNGRDVYTLPWLDLCKFNEMELRKAQIKLEAYKQESKEQRERFERTIIERFKLEDD